MPSELRKLEGFCHYLNTILVYVVLSQTKDELTSVTIITILVVLF